MGVVNRERQAATKVSIAERAGENMEERRSSRGEALLAVWAESAADWPVSTGNRCILGHASSSSYSPTHIPTIIANMLAHRDQENLVHSHQTAAASKPLNQNVKPLQPRTPGTRLPKTPFKVPLNDENDPLTFGKKTIRGSGRRNENAKPAKDAFQTPLGKVQPGNSVRGNGRLMGPETRSRAPLGMKTTNAKARGIQTPAPLGTAKPEKTNKKSSTQKANKPAPPAQQQSRPDVRDKVSEDDVPDIEYMPPKPQGGCINAIQLTGLTRSRASRYSR